MDKSMGAELANSPMKFAPANGVAYFESMGWSVIEVHSILHAAAKFGRLPWFLSLFAFFPAADPRRLDRARWSGVLRLARPKPPNE
jgi:hypothetical protein